MQLAGLSLGIWDLMWWPHSQVECEKASQVAVKAIVTNYEQSGKDLSLVHNNGPVHLVHGLPLKRLQLQ